VARTTTPPASSTTTAPKDFDTILKQYLTPGKANNVSEEALFASVVAERVTTLEGDKAASEFATSLAAHEKQMTNGGYVAYEAATKAALRELRDKGTISKEDADKIYSESFAASQLDNNAESLWDDVGGANDPSIAIDTMDSAMAKAKDKVAIFDKDPTAYQARSLDEGEASKPIPTAELSPNAASANSGSTEPGANTPVGGRIDGPQGFLFKPVSAHGSLVVLLSPSETSSTDSISLVDSTGKVIEKEGQQGALAGRGIYRFKKPGAQYPANLSVQIKHHDGSVRKISIPDPSKRWD
jgi:hypothetical protein